MADEIMLNEEAPVDIDLDALVQEHGLVYHDHMLREERVAGGQVKKVWMRTERPMTGAEVLSHRFVGEDVILTTADGQKWRFGADGSARNLMEE